ncbi:MAG: hypothetical protein K0R82_1414, partial [Flavipsychrobacter sp.]|nr:hypothetical protein [Flavipsychrobacter sp.]
MADSNKLLFLELLPQMRFLSLDYLTTQAEETFKRFPLPLVFAITGTFTAVGMISQEIDDNSFLIKLLFTCILALPFTIGATLFAERRAGSKAVIPGIATVMVILYGIFLAPDKFGQTDVATISFFVLCLVMHLWVAIAAYTKTDERLGFWRFNETLYVRMFISVIFSGALFAGLALAIYALDNLLQFTIDPKTYAQLWMVIAGIFNTWFFLGGVPRNFTELHLEKEYPKGLKIFAQYILIPLATIYLIILYAYGGKILAIWNLPKGWVSMLIMCYAVIGILAVLLVYPLRNDEDKPWVRLFSRFFFIAMLPVTVLLFVAIGVRIRQYGVTEPRYYLVALGCWLVCIALYFIFSKQKNIKVIPATLILVGLFSLFGPWSAFSVSSISQYRILKNTLERNKIWENGKLLAHGDVDAGVERRTRDLLQYFIERDKDEKLGAIFNLDITDLKDTVAQRMEKIYRDDPWAVNSATVDTLMSLLQLRSHTYAR